MVDRQEISDMTKHGGAILSAPAQPESQWMSEGEAAQAGEEFVGQSGHRVPVDIADRASDVLCRLPGAKNDNAACIVSSGRVYLTAN